MSYKDSFISDLIAYRDRYVELISSFKLWGLGYMKSIWSMVACLGSIFTSEEQCSKALVARTEGYRTSTIQLTLKIQLYLFGVGVLFQTFDAKLFRSNSQLDPIS